MTENTADFFQQDQLAAYLETIQPQILASLATARVNPDLPFGDLFPWRIDWVLQDIIDHIVNLGKTLWDAASWIRDRILEYLAPVRDWVLDGVLKALAFWWPTAKPILEDIWNHIVSIWSEVYHIASDVFHNVSQALEGFVTTIISNISSFFNNLPGYIGGLFTQVWNWITTAVSNITNVIGGWVQGILPAISSFFANFWQNIIPWFNNIILGLQKLFVDLQPLFHNLGVLVGNITGDILIGIEGWASGLWKTIQDWFTQDAHQSLANMEKDSLWPVEAHGSPFLETFLRSIWQSANFAVLIPGKILDALLGGHSFGNEPFYTILAEYLGWILELPLKGVDAMVRSIGIVSPSTTEGSLSIIEETSKITIGALAGMTMIGELCKAWAHMGFGHIAAVLFDMSNYKAVTGAQINIIADTYLTRPLRYYFNEIARPNLPGVGDLMKMAGEYSFAGSLVEDYRGLVVKSVQGIDVINKNVFQWAMKWHGFTDEWIERMYNITKRPISYFGMRAMADAGMFDENYFVGELLHNGYNADTISHMVTMLRAYSEGDVKPLMVGAATKRYRNGLSTEDQLKTELSSLGVPVGKLDKYVFASNLDYQVDFAADLLSAYRTQYNKGMVDESAFRDNLSAIGIVPDRIEGIVLLENAKLFKAPKTIKAPVPIPDYLTDTGQLKVTTTRDAFRKDLISAAELESQLVNLQMPPDLAEAFVQAEIIRKTPVATPYYLTDEGKVQVDTAREAFRKGVISDADLRNELTRLEVPPDLAEAIVQYELTKQLPKAS